MAKPEKPKHRAALIWAALLLSALAPLIAAAFSPYLAFRQPIYIAAGFAGITAMALMLFQPLLAAGLLPGVSLATSRKAHRWVGATLLLAVLLHVAGLWFTSPPDVMDALTFTSPTPFAPFGVIAMWALVISALWATFRRRLGTSPRGWRRGHSALALLVVIGTVAHALLIEGTMETVTKTLLSLLLLLALALALNRLRPWGRATRPADKG